MPAEWPGNTVQGPSGPPGPPGPPGSQGPAGPKGELSVYMQDDRPADATAGSIWFDTNG